MADVQISAFDLNNHTLSGKGTEGDYLEVCVNTDNGCDTRFATVDSNGDWTASIPSLALGTNGWVGLTDDEGDTTEFDWNINTPHITANVQDQWIETRDWWEGTDVTLDIRNGDYTETKTVIHNPENQGDPNDIRAHFDITAENSFAVGDVITVSNADASISTSLTVAALEITQIDQANATISGVATQGDNLDVCVNTGQGCAMRHVLAGDGGAWMAAFQAAGAGDDEKMILASFAPGTNGWAAVVDGNGNQSFAGWNLPEGPYLVVAPADDWIQGWNFSPNATISITVPGGLGSPYDLTTDENGHFWLDKDTTGVDLVPDMVIIAAQDAQGISKSVTVIPITLDSVNFNTDVMSGTAPADAVVSVDAGNPEGGHNIQTTAGSDGNWSVDFSTENFDLTPDMDFGANLIDAEGDRNFADLTRSMYMTVSLADNRVEADYWPAGAPLHLSVQDGEGTYYSADSVSVIFPISTDHTQAVFELPEGIYPGRWAVGNGKLPALPGDVTNKKRPGAIF